MAGRFITFEGGELNCLGISLHINVCDTILSCDPLGGIVEGRKGKLVLDLFKFLIGQGLAVKYGFIATLKDRAQICP